MKSAAYERIWHLLNSLCTITGAASLKSLADEMVVRRLSSLCTITGAASLKSAIIEMSGLPIAVSAPSPVQPH